MKQVPGLSKLLNRETLGGGGGRKLGLEMSQWLRTLAVLLEDPGLIPNTHVIAKKHL